MNDAISKTQIFLNGSFIPPYIYAFALVKINERKILPHPSFMVSTITKIFQGFDELLCINLKIPKVNSEPKF